MGIVFSAPSCHALTPHLVPHHPTPLFAVSNPCRRVICSHGELYGETYRRMLRLAGQSPHDAVAKALFRVITCIDDEQLRYTPAVAACMEASHDMLHSLAGRVAAVKVIVLVVALLQPLLHRPADPDAIGWNSVLCWLLMSSLVYQLVDWSTQLWYDAATLGRYLVGSLVLVVELAVHCVCGGTCRALHTRVLVGHRVDAQTAVCSRRPCWFFLAAAPA